MPAKHSFVCIQSFHKGCRNRKGNARIRLIQTAGFFIDDLAKHVDLVLLDQREHRLGGLALRAIKMTQQSPDILPC